MQNKWIVVNILLPSLSTNFVIGFLLIYGVFHTLLMVLSHFFLCFHLKFTHIALLTQRRSTVEVWAQHSDVWVFRPSLPCCRGISKWWQPQWYKESGVINLDIPCWIGILLLSKWPSSVLCLWAQCSCLWWDWGVQRLLKPRLDWLVCLSTSCMCISPKIEYSMQFDPGHAIHGHPAIGSINYCSGSSSE